MLPSTRTPAPMIVTVGLAEPFALLLFRNKGFAPPFFSHQNVKSFSNTVR